MSTPPVFISRVDLQYFQPAFTANAFGVLQPDWSIVSNKLQAPNWSAPQQILVTFGASNVQPLSGEWSTTNWRLISPQRINPIKVESVSSSQVLLTYPAGTFTVSNWSDYSTASPAPSDISVDVAVAANTFTSTEFPLGNPTSLTTVANGGPYTGFNNQASLPNLLVFSITQELYDYLSTAYPNDNPYKHVYITLSGGATSWPNLSANLPGSTYFPNSQTGSQGKQILSPGISISLFDLESPLPTGYKVTATAPGGSTANQADFQFGLTQAGAQKLSQSYGDTNNGYDVPNILLNDFSGGRFYVSVDDGSTNGSLTSSFSYGGLTAPGFTGPTSPTFPWSTLAEIHAATQPGFAGAISDFNLDLTYIDAFSIPESAFSFGHDGSQLPTDNNYNYQTTINGGVSGTSTTASIKTALNNAALTSALSGSALLSPGQAPNGTYHDWSDYLTYLATGLDESGGSLPITTLKGGPISSSYYNLIAAIFSNGGFGSQTQDQDGFIVLSGDFGSGQGSLYLPYSSKSPLPSNYNALNQNYGVTQATFLSDPAGLYGGNAGYYWYPGQTFTGLDATAISNYVTATANSADQTFSSPSAGLNKQETEQWAVSDLFFGLNYGLPGSTVLFPATGSQQIGAIDSSVWYAPTGPVASGYWGPWAQPENAASNNQATLTSNTRWNTWAFALNGSLSTTGYSSPNIPNTTDAAAAGYPLVPNVYGFAYSDRLGNVLLGWAPIDSGTGQYNWQYPQGTVPPTGGGASPIGTAENFGTGAAGFLIGLPQAYTPVTPIPTPTSTVLREVGFGGTASSNGTINVNRTIPEFSSNAFLFASDIQLPVNAYSYGIFSNTAGTTTYTPIISNPSARASNSLDLDLGISLGGSASLANFMALAAPTEGASVGANNLSSCLIMPGTSSTQLGTYLSNSSLISKSTDPGNVLSNSSGDIITNFSGQNPGQLSLYTGIFTLTDSTSGDIQLQAGNIGSNTNTLYAYSVDSVTGAILDSSGAPVDPSSSQYRDLALGRTFFSKQLTSGASVETVFKDAANPAPDLFAFALVSQGPSGSATWFSVVSGNSDGIPHLLSLGSNVYGFEDLAKSQSDLDYNDFIFSLKPVTT